MQSLRGPAVLLFLCVTAGQAVADDPVPRFRTETVWVEAPPLRHHISKTLFVNRCPGDCQITVGSQSDARSNVSSIAPGNTTISEFDLGNEVFDATIACLRDVYQPYDVDIVTVDPGMETFHHEAILAGYPEEMGRDALVGGVAPASCEPLDNVISFSFANALGDSISGERLIETLCWTLAQESAHSFGLPNHVFDCLDPMTYLPLPGDPWCGRKYFRNRGIQCGEFEPSASCNCGGSVQNSHRELLAVFGEGATVAPPTVSVSLPAPDAQVSDKFSIFFNALDPRLVSYAEIWLNGTRYFNLPGKDYFNQDAVYSAEAPEHPDGYIDLEIRACNELNSCGSQSLTVLKGAPCTDASQCFEHMSCEDGRCKYPPPAGELGDSCDYDQYCQSGICANAGSDGICSQSCTPGVEGACPDGLDCTAEGVCYGGGDGGGCCTIAGGQGEDDRFPLVALSLFAAVIVVLRLRSRRRG